MAERLSRAITPVATTESVSAGNVRCRISASTSRSPYIGHMPETGNIRRFTANTRIIIIPRKNEGIEIPRMTAKVMPLSATPYCRVAEITPATMPSTEHSTNAVPARISVALSRSSTSSSTGRLNENDWPKSPCSMLPSQIR